MQFIINNPNGKVDLNGEVTLQGAKNSMLNNLCLPILTNEECIIENAPDITDVNINLEILAQMSAKIKRKGHTVSIRCDALKPISVSPELSKKTTGSKFFIPLLVNRFGTFETGSIGGCDLGDRGFENYANSLKDFGIDHERNGDRYRFFKTPTSKLNHHLDFPSFGLTVNAILASVGQEGITTISNVCQEPEIDNTIEMLNKMGAGIEKEGDTELKINGQKSFSGCTFRNMSDRNVAVTYAAMAVITNSKLAINNFDNLKMGAFFRFLNSINAQYEVSGNQLTLLGNTGRLNPVQIKAFLYPEFHSDWQALVAPLLTQADGKSHIEEKLFPNRLQYWNELEKMGAHFENDPSIQTRFKDGHPHAVTIMGPTPLKGAHVTALDLRGGAALIVAALKATGTTIIENAEMIDRGYEAIDQTLRQLGVSIIRK